MQFFQNLTPKKILGIAFVAVLAIGLPLTLIATRSQQNVGSKAAGTASVKLEPSTFSASVNQQFDVNATIAAGINKVEYVKIDFTYTDPLTEVTFTPSSTYVPIIGPTVNTAAKKITFEGANTSQTSATGNINLGVLHVKGTATGTGQIAYANIQLFDNLGDILVLENNITGTYTIGSGTDSVSFNFNNGLNHCRPTIEGCETSLGESVLNNGDCSTYLGTTAQTCTATNGYSTNGTGVIDSICPTISSDNHIQYCIPTNRSVPSGWVEITTGNNICTTYNTVPSKCYKSTFTTTQTSPTITAIPPPLPDCSSDTNRPANCTCSTNSQCASKVCNLSLRDTQNDATGVCTAGTTTSPTVTTVPSVTITQIPTTTVAPGETGLKLSIKLPGIGKVSGDNASPVRIRRTAKVYVFDSTNAEVVHEKTGALDYNATTGRYEGNIGIGTSITTGSYTVKVRMDNTLIKRLPGIVVITSGKADNTTPQAGLISGDLDQDNALGVQDYTNFLACFHGAASCTGDSALFADINDNGSANGDNDDMNILQYNYVNRQGD